jgi:hypothetical protein
MDIFKASFLGLNHGPFRVWQTATPCAVGDVIAVGSCQGPGRFVG